MSVGGSGVRILSGRGSLSVAGPWGAVGRVVVVVMGVATVRFGDAFLAGRRRLRGFRCSGGPRGLLCGPGVVEWWTGAGVWWFAGGEGLLAVGRCERSSGFLKGKRSSRDLPEAKADTTRRYLGS